MVGFFRNRNSPFPRSCLRGLIIGEYLESKVCGTMNSGDGASSVGWTYKYGIRVIYNIRETMFFLFVLFHTFFYFFAKK